MGIAHEWFLFGSEQEAFVNLSRSHERLGPIVHLTEHLSHADHPSSAVLLVRTERGVGNGRDLAALEKLAVCLIESFLKVRKNFHSVISYIDFFIAFSLLFIFFIVSLFHLSLSHCFSFFIFFIFFNRFIVHCF